MPRPKGERKLEILKALAQMLEAPKWEKITTAALAEKLGVSEAALYRHFASKAQMYEGLIDFIESSVFTLANRITEDEADGELQAGKLLEMLLAFAEKNPGKKWGLITQDDDYGITVRDGFDTVVKARKLNVVYSGNYKKGQQDFSSDMLQLKDSGAEVFLAGGIIGENIAMMKELEKLSIKPVVGIFWPGRVEPVLKLMGPAGDGIYAVDYVEPFAGAAGKAFLEKAKGLLPEAEMKGINQKLRKAIEAEGRLEGIEGLWWQFSLTERTAEEPSAMSLLRISRDRNGMLEVSGRSWQSDGTLSARYRSEAATERKDPAGVFYYWRGERPRHANAPQVDGTGEIRIESPDRATVVITHYQRLLDYIVPDSVHVLYKGKIIRSGDKALALELENNGYADIIGEAA